MPQQPTAFPSTGTADLPELARMLHQLRRRARGRHGSALTYRELAAKTGWSRAIIGEYFTGAALPPTDRLDQLLQVLGATGPERDLLVAARDRVDEVRRDQARSVRSAEPEPAPVPSLPDGMPPRPPAPASALFGRWRQLSELDRLAGSDTDAMVIAVLSGDEGAGKTALAVHWAHTAANRFPDGRFYLDLNGSNGNGGVAAADALGHLLRVLGCAGSLPETVDARAMRYRSLLAGRRVLVLLDDAGSADQVRPLLPGSATSMVLVTSRSSMSGLVAADGARRIPLAAPLLPRAGSASYSDR